jgi:hypothetical protein
VGIFAWISVEFSVDDFSVDFYVDCEMDLCLWAASTGIASVVWMGMCQRCDKSSFVFHLVLSLSATPTHPTPTPFHFFFIWLFS